VASIISPLSAASKMSSIVPLDQLTELQTSLEEGLHGGSMKMAVLIWLSLQTALHSLLIRYSRARDVPQMFYGSVAVFCTEVLKTLVCLAMVVVDSKSIGG
jgi:hypothetical protein